MTPKQREKLVSKAVKALDAAAEAMNDLQAIAIDYDRNIDMKIEERFRSELRERAKYWENATWWK